MSRPDNKDRSKKVESEFVEKLVNINRVAKVTKGGKNFAFSALMVIGDGKGRVGHGLGKAREVPEAVQKATEAAKRNIQRIPLKEGRTLHHDIKGTFGAGHVVLRTAPSGTGIIAGGPIRAACEVVGIKDIVAKSLGSSNPINVLRACIKGLKNQSSPKHIANIRGKKINEITKKKQ